MHILLTDLLTCPRCGPDFGLIVLADRLEDRQVVEGRLGCSNCRESFPVAGGVADLRYRGGAELEAGHGDPEAEQAFRTAALMGVQGGAAAVLVVEPDGSVAAAIAELLPALHVLSLSVDQPVGELPARGMLSRLRAGARLPIRSRAMRGVAALGVDVGPLLDDIHRALIPGGRLVLDPAPPGAADTLVAAGFTVLLDQDGVTVAALSEPG